MDGIIEKIRSIITKQDRLNRTSRLRIKHSFLVVSYSIPERASGTPVVIRKFLENFNKDEVVLIGRPTLKNERIENITFHYPTMTIPTPPVGFRGERLWRFLSIFGGVITGLIAIRRYKVKAILAFYRDESSLLIGYLLHKFTKLPLFSYFCDIYLENYPNGWYGKIARWLQPRVFRASKKIIVLTEAMKDYFWRHYHIDTIILPHCNNIKIVKKKIKKMHNDICKIGYLGTINIDRLQSLQILCQALRGNNDYQLIYFTLTSKKYIQKNNLDIENSLIEFIPDEQQMMNRLSTCDVLFLPLAKAPERDERNTQVLTGFPTKVIDYLLCQVPILAHSNKNSFGAKFLEDHQCGYVVDGGLAELNRAIAILACNNKLRKQLVQNSINALSYFDGNSISNSFRKIISDFY